MEAAAYVAGEPHSDHPHCVSAVIAKFLRIWNDAIPDDETRTRLLVPLIPRIIGTSATEDIELRRSYLALDWLIREVVPVWLDSVRLYKNAAKLRAYAEITDRKSTNFYGIDIDICEAKDAVLRVVNNYKETSPSRNVLEKTAIEAAFVTSQTAVWDAAYSTTESETIVVNTLSVVLDIVQSAAAGLDLDRLQNTVETIQRSAIELVECMCESRG